MTRHDADEVIGRITSDGYWDRRYKPQYQQAEPVEVGWREVLTILGQAAYILVILGSLIFFSALFAAMAVTQP